MFPTKINDFYFVIGFVVGGSIIDELVFKDLTSLRFPPRTLSIGALSHPIIVSHI